MRSTANSEVFVDTWGWVALGYRQDNCHQQVTEIYRTLRSANILLHTSDYVLDEVMTLLFRREVFAEAVRFMEGIFAAAELRQLQIHRVTSEYFAAAWRLRMQYQDKPLISFTDLTSMVIMRSQGLQTVLTQDEHFIQVGLGFSRLP
ncbi:MAG: PIN domain-containing protein [Elainella sp. C42_A2020_010]|nr:PIN domain-containing protein [Elainella sp. C42_A2020_010]